MSIIEDLKTNTSEQINGELPQFSNLNYKLWSLFWDQDIYHINIGYLYLSAS